MHMLSTSLFYKKFNSLSIHHLVILVGLSCISCAAHQIHISLPANPLLDSGPGNPLLVIPLSDLCVNADLIEILLPGFRIGPLVNLALYLPFSYDLFNSSTTSVFLGQVRFHHFTLGVVFIIVSLIGYSFQQLQQQQQLSLQQQLMDLLLIVINLRFATTFSESMALTVLDQSSNNSFMLYSICSSYLCNTNVSAMFFKLCNCALFVLSSLM